MAGLGYGPGDKSTAIIRLLMPLTATAGWFHWARVVDLTDVDLGDGSLDKEPNVMTTEAPAPDLVGQFIEADTELDLGSSSYYLRGSASG